MAWKSFGNSSLQGQEWWDEEEEEELERAGTALISSNLLVTSCSSNSSILLTGDAREGEVRLLDGRSAAGGVNGRSDDSKAQGQSVILGLRWYWSCIGCTDRQNWFNGNHLHPMQSAGSGRQWLSIHIRDDVGILTLMDVKIIPSKRALPYHLLPLVQVRFKGSTMPLDGRLAGSLKHAQDTVIR